MRVVLIAVGSRGDAEPFCSLAASLANTEKVTVVDVFLQTDLEYLVPAHAKIQYHPLPFTQMDFYKYAGKERKPPQPGAGHPNPRVNFLGMVTDIMGELVLPCYENVSAVAGKADAVVASSLARQLAMEVVLQARMTNRDPILYLVQLQSIIPTRDYPHYSQTDACVEALLKKKEGQEADGEANLESYLQLERFQHEFLRVHVDQKLAGFVDGYTSNDQSSLNVDTTLSLLQGQPLGDNPPIDLWMVNAVSTDIIPPVKDAGPKILNVGGLADRYIPKDFEPPQDLVNFLKRQQQKPVCFGYGSMPFGKAEMLVDAAFQAKRPSILVGSAMMNVVEKHSNDLVNEKAGWIRDHIFCVTNIPYPWLLPQCSMMLSHGGAGVLHATLRAGIPAVISPFLGDQFFFAKYVQAKGWGVQASDNMMSLTKEDVLRSIQEADACRDACKRLGESMAIGEQCSGTNSSNIGQCGPEILTVAIVQHVGCKSK